MTALPTLHPAGDSPLDARPDSDARPATAGHEARVPVLDGVRGLAILLVMAHHFFVIPATVGPDGVERFPTKFDAIVASVVHSGWWGVDLFFVLSGFLITGILFDSKGRPHYFRNFYARRTVRIFPLYYAFLFLMLIVLPRLLRPEVARNFGELHGSQAWYWAYLSNFRIAWLGNYDHRTLSPTWSLAIEEQFYLVWPAVVLLLGRRGLMRAAGVMIAASFATRLGLYYFDPNPGMKVYCMTFCRLDGLAIGAWIALFLRGEGQPLARLAKAARVVGLLAVLAIAGLLVTDSFVEIKFLDALFLTALALAFGSLLVTALGARPTSLVARGFASAPMRVFGTYSYAIYLLHYPISLALAAWVFKPARFPTIAGSPMPGQLVFYALATAVTLGVAWVSWNVFEKHFLKLKKYFPTGK